jgi:hypothetical protein
MKTNIEVSTFPRGLKPVSHYLEQSVLVTESGKINCSCGAVFELALPTMNPVYFCADYKLAKIVLCGDSANGVIEGEKSSMMKTFNYIDRNVSTIFS